MIAILFFPIHINADIGIYNKIYDLYFQYDQSIQESINVDDIIETTNHFRCIDLIIDKAKARLTETFIKELHLLLRSGTSDSRKDWFHVGEYKKFPNEVGGNETCPPKEVATKIKELLSNYHSVEKKSIEDIIDFHGGKALNQ